MRTIVSLLLALCVSTGAFADDEKAVGETKGAYGTLFRTTIVARHADLEPSVKFWRDVMGFEYAGDPKPNTGNNSSLGWNADATSYYTKFTAVDGSMIGLVLIEGMPGFPDLKLPNESAAYGGVVLVVQASDLKSISDRAAAAGFEFLQPYELHRSGGWYSAMIKSPTGHIIEAFETVPSPD